MKTFGKDASACKKCEILATSILKCKLFVIINNIKPATLINFLFKTDVFLHVLSM